MWNSFKSIRSTSRTINKGESAGVDKAFEGLDKAFEGLGSAFDDLGDSFKSMAKDFESSDRIENDKVAVTVNGGDIDIKGAVGTLRINGKKVVFKEPEENKKDKPKEEAAAPQCDQGKY